MIVSDHIKWSQITSHTTREQVWTLCSENVIFDAYKVQISTLFNTFSFASLVNCFAHTLIIFVKSETPLYTQNTYAYTTCSLITPSRCVTLDFMLNNWPCVKCGWQDMMPHSMASVLIIRMKDTRYNVALYSLCISSTIVW